MGKREYQCTPWGNPTYNIFGWQKPCYLLQDGYVSSFKELLETTAWDRYGVGRNEKMSGLYGALWVRSLSRGGNVWFVVRVDRNRERPCCSPRDLTAFLPVFHFTVPMSQDGPEAPSEQSLPGAVFRPTSQQEVLNVIELAFGYRGDITLELKSRECINGYLY